MRTFFEPEAVDAHTRTLVRRDVACLHRRLELDEDAEAEDVIRLGDVRQRLTAMERSSAVVCVCGFCVAGID